MVSLVIVSKYKVKKGIKRMVAIDNKIYVMRGGPQPRESTSNLNEIFLISKR